MFAALILVLAVLGVGLTGFTGLTDLTRLAGFTTSRVREAPATTPRPTAPPPAAVATKEAPSAPPAPQASPARIVVEEQAEQVSSGIPPTPAPTPPKALATEPGPLVQPVSSVAPAPEQPASASPAPAQEPPRAMPATAEAPKQPRDVTARVIVDVSPRGEIYIDGDHRGTTPPLTTFDLTPGMHRIEVRNGSRKPYLTYMNVQDGDVRRIRHDFDAKPSRPPG